MFILPPPALHLVHEIAIRWGVTPARIAGWAMEGLLALHTVLPPASTDNGGVISGLVEVRGEEVLPVLRSCGTILPSVRILHARKGQGDEWEKIVDTIAIQGTDVMLMRIEAERFEREFNSACKASRPPMLPGPGVAARYDWDSFYAAIARRIHHHGIPTSVGELVREMQQWFARRDDDNVPDESTIRKKAQIVLREVRRA